MGGEGAGGDDRQATGCRRCRMRDAREEGARKNTNGQCQHAAEKGGTNNAVIGGS